MEKPVRSKGNKILKYLKKPPSFSISAAPFSPGRNRRPDNSLKPKPMSYKTFSGPLVIPAEARRREKTSGYDAPEPTSPKVSCIGQIKHKKANRSRRKSSSSSSTTQPQRMPSCTIRKMFQRKVQPRRRSESEEDLPEVAPARAPALGQLKRFTSGRETLASFDWKKVVDDRTRDGDEQSEEEVMIPHSAPIVMGGSQVAVEPRKEVNLWKRRTTTPPLPIQLD